MTFFKLGITKHEFFCLCKFDTYGGSPYYCNKVGGYISANKLLTRGGVQNPDFHVNVIYELPQGLLIKNRSKVKVFKLCLSVADSELPHVGFSFPIKRDVWT